MSMITVSNVSDGTLSIPTTYVTNGSAKAWVNFNGTGTIAARGSLNLSSLTDNGTGDYSVNFSSAMGNANYAMAGTAHDVSTTNKPRFIGSYSKSTTACSLTCSYQDNLVIDAQNVELPIHGDLA